MNHASGLIETDKPFIFISYARKDAEKVRKFLQGLEEKNYRFWYDAGLKPGHEWDKGLAEKIEQCDCFFAILSGNYIVSSYCEAELGYAIKQGKFVVPIYLEEVELPGSWYLQIGRKQYLRLYEEKDKVWEKLEKSEEVRRCRAGNVAQAAESDRSPQNHRKPSGRARRVIPVALALLLLLAAGIFSYFRWIKPDTGRSLVLLDKENRWTTKGDYITIDSDKSDVPWLPNILILHLNRANPDSIPDKIILQGKLDETDGFQDLITIPSENLENDRTNGNGLLLNLVYSEEMKKNRYSFFRLEVFLKEHSDSVEIDRAELQRK